MLNKFEAEKIYDYMFVGEEVGYNNKLETVVYLVHQYKAIKFLERVEK